MNESTFTCRGCAKKTTIAEPSLTHYECRECGSQMIIWPEWVGSKGLDLISAERRRQVEEEGWDPEHDAEHTDDSLAWAAVCYASPDRVFRERHVLRSIRFEDPWPWDQNWDARMTADKARSLTGVEIRKARIRELTKAGALVAAEIDRLAALPVPYPKVKL